jgi:hypothetical protein
MMFERDARRELSASAFCDGQDLIDARLFDHLALAAQPMHFNFFHPVNLAQAEPCFRSGLRMEETRCSIFSKLPLAPRFEVDFRSVAGTVAAPAHQVNRQPVVVVAPVVSQQHRPSVVGHHNHVQIAVVVVVGAGRPPGPQSPA